YEHLLALLSFPDVERRGGDVRDHVRSGERQIGRGRAGLPNILADRRADQRLAQLQEEELPAGLEVAQLVEHSVVRKEALRVDRPNFASGENRAGVVEVALEPRKSDQGGGALSFACHPIEALSRSE